MSDFEKQLKMDFLDEAKDNIQGMEDMLLALESDKNNQEHINELFRLAHNIKGTSRAVGYGFISEFVHEIENLILQFKEGRIHINDFCIQLLLECNDVINNFLVELRSNPDASFDFSSLANRVKDAITRGLNGELDSESKSVKEEVSTPNASQFEDDSFDTNVFSEVTQNPIPIKTTNEVPNLKDTPTIESTELSFEFSKTEDNSKSKDQPKSKKNEDDSIRVSLERVEKLNNFVGELVILQTVLEQRKYVGIEDELAIKSISQLGKLSKEIQEISMSLRMTPIKSTMHKLNRIVRDTSKSLGKDVDLKLVGEETEVDKTVLEHLSDPLVHIVRNALDHGLELPDERRAIGKRSVGMIEIRSFHEGNNLIIEIKDDGKGIDPENVKRKAIERNIIAPNAELSDYEIIQLIFAPGFSTKEQVSEVSGRGVGMDVVKTNIERLSGLVDVETDVGQGSLFRITLPLTTAIIDGMVVQVGKEKFIVPISQVSESLKPQNEAITYVSGIGNCLNLRGDVYPLMSLSQALNLGNSEKKLDEQIAIIVNSPHVKFGVVVDDVLHQQQVVIKKIGPEIKVSKGFMGSSILGDGKPAFILELNEMFSNLNSVKNLSDVFNKRVA